MTTIKNKAWTQEIRNGINKSCTSLYKYKSARKWPGEDFDLDVNVYICPCGQLTITDLRDRTGRGLDHTEYKF